jgi:hypothetical protein
MVREAGKANVVRVEAVTATAYPALWIPRQTAMHWRLSFAPPHSSEEFGHKRVAFDRGRG